MGKHLFQQISALNWLTGSGAIASRQQAVLMKPFQSW
jgi:hypothetical protein